jgi:Uma2 family endonuclease
MTKSMTAEEFVAWAEKRPEKHWELFDGVPQMQQSQTWGHARHVYRIARAMDDAIKASGLPLSFGVEGIVVKIGPRTAFEPDIVVFAGRMDDRDIIAPDPIVVVEVLSPSTEKKDLKVKLAGYFDVPSLQHYLIADWQDREIVHHRREGGGLAKPAAVRVGGLILEPPGLILDVGWILKPD